MGRRKDKSVKKTEVHKHKMLTSLGDIKNNFFIRCGAMSSSLVTVFINTHFYFYFFQSTNILIEVSSCMA